MTIAVRMLCRLNTHLRKIDKRAAALAATAFTLWLFGESILPLLLHGLQLGIEVVELAFEHLLEWAFGLSRRAAQTITFWTGIFLIAYASLRLVRRAFNELRRACDGVWSRLQHWINGRPPPGSATLTHGSRSPWEQLARPCICSPEPRGKGAVAVPHQSEDAPTPGRGLR